MNIFTLILAITISAILCGCRPYTADSIGRAIQTSNGNLQRSDNSLSSDSNASSETSSMSLYEVAKKNSNFKTLTKALEITGLDSALNSAVPFTVFAPTDSAFDQLPPGLLSSLISNKDVLKNVLLYHVVHGSVTAEQASTLTEATMLNGQMTKIIRRSGFLFINKSKIVTTDIRGRNGIIHVINKVLVPPSNILDELDKAGHFNVLLKAIKAAGLEEAVKSNVFTIFAPTDEAFSQIPVATLDALVANPEKLKAVLLYHVIKGQVTYRTAVGLTQATTVQGQGVKIRNYFGYLLINDSFVISRDNFCSNGVIHAINKVLLPQ